MWNQLDGLTGLLNQNSFLNRSEEMNYANGMLIVFDVDDLNMSMMCMVMSKEICV